jgi:hypothetical protein
MIMNRVMRRPTAPKWIVLALAAAGLLAAGAGQSLASTSSVQSLKTVTVVMRDPGCHWFAVHGKFVSKLTVKGPVALRNLDEAALKVVGPQRVSFEKVGKKMTLGKGVYRITMVGQAPDDLHLKLTVK